MGKVTGMRAAAGGALLLTVAVVTATRFPIGWDGGWYLFRTLHEGTPTIAFDRYGAWILQAPALAVRGLGVDVAGFVFSLAYALVPAGAIAVAAWWHRDHRPAFYWSVIGITVSVLTAQAFMISEMVIAVQVWWPAFMLAATGRWPDRRVGPWVVVALALLLHPVAVPLLALTGVVLWTKGSRATSVVLWVAAVARWSMLAPTESDRVASPFEVLWHGSELKTLAIWSLVGGMVLLVTSDRVPALPVAAAAGLLVGGAAVAVAVAVQSDELHASIAARGSIVSSVGVLAVVAWWHATGRVEWRPLRLAAVGAVILHAVVLSGMAFVWHGTVVRELHPVLAGGCSETGDFASTHLNTWSTAGLAVVLQDREPDGVVLTDGGCGRSDLASALQMAPWGPPVPREGGWFDLANAGGHPSP